MIVMITAFVLGWYLGVASVFGTWAYIQDDFDDPPRERAIVGAMIGFGWGIIIIGIIIEEVTSR